MDKNLFPVITELTAQLPIYLTTVGGWSHQEDVHRVNGFPDYLWLQVLQGEGELTVEGKTSKIVAGQGMLLLPKIEYKYRATQKPWETRWVSFNGRHMADFLEPLGLNKNQVLYLTNPDLILSKMYQMFTIVESQTPSTNLECSGILYGLLLDLYKYTSQTEVRSKHHHFEQISPILTYIEEHYSDPLTLQQLSSQISVSPQYTCLLFQNTLGMRPFEYITKYRIRKAKELLIKSADTSISDVGRLVGYENSSYFIKLFKEHEGLTPNVFRSIYRRRR